ncbi:MAG TPA: hypothetical protein DCZ04_15685 [Syntrophorhabdus aromaticivorans]|nr:hypothetical protein [Syntrophorhabdus aromaticivorans]
MDGGMEKIIQVWYAASLADRRRTECTSDGRMAKHRATDGHFRTGRWPTKERENENYVHR